jgi:multiple antibiotic resistance protein
LLVIALDLLRGETERLSGAAKTNVAFVPWARHCWPGRARSWPSWSSSARPERGDQRLGIALGLLACWRCCVCPCAVLACSSGSSRAGIDLTTCISGLLLSAIAVQLVVDAVREFTRAGL